MKLSLSWLNDYVDVKTFFAEPQKLADLLTRAGLEVEEMKDHAKDFNHVVIGQILEKDQHPNADKLSLCRVATGDGVVHQIVCGAQNHKQGDRVIVALPGAVLPGNFAIKKSAVRGVDSAGMLCSYKELGLATESDGIAILPADATVGQSFAQYSGLNDVTFELKVTPNRADCLSHYGLAREVACLINGATIAPKTHWNATEISKGQSLDINVLAPEAAPRYAGRIIEGVKVGPSPAWLKQRLEKVGMKSINNVVDVTNFVMMELGQPLHAFDLAKIEGGRLQIGLASVGEKFKTLDGTELTLKGTELTIRDAHKALCIGGVIGGANSGVTESTQDIFLEAAYFTAMGVRKASRAHGINTDSGYRFSRGVDPEGVKNALDRATALLVDVAGAKASEDHFDFYPNKSTKKEIPVRIPEISERLGFEAKEDLFVQFMQALGCKVAGSGGVYQILPPSYRFDLEQKVDLIEEYARLVGYENIPETLPTFKDMPTSHDKNYVLQKSVSEQLRAQGYQQSLNLVFAKPSSEDEWVGSWDHQKETGLGFGDQVVGLLNPLNEESSSLRRMLSLGLFKNVLTNALHGNEYGRSFEMGSVFGKSADGYVESQRLGLAVWGRSQNLWNAKAATPLVFELKAAVEALLRSMNISSFTWVQGEPDKSVSLLHPGQYAVLNVEGRKLGYLGTLHPAISEKHKIRCEVALAEFDLESLLKGQPRPTRVQSLSSQPVVERDFSFLISKAVKAGDVVKEMKKAVGALAVNAEVFDLFEGDKLPEGQRSLAVRVYLQDKNATLQDAQITEATQKIWDSLKKNFNVSNR